jgi:hypothetical protein
MKTKLFEVTIEWALGLLLRLEFHGMGADGREMPLALLAGACRAAGAG